MGVDPLTVGIGAALLGGGTAAAAALQPGAPQTPDYATASREGVMADVSTLPLRKMIESAARLGKAVTYTDPVTGEQKTADFTGLGDTDQTLAQLDSQIQGSDRLAGAALALDQKYGGDYIAQRLKELEASDPTGFALRKAMGSVVTGELNQGYNLAPGMRAEVEQATRAAQAARGNILGAAPAAAEAMETGNAGYRLFQQRLANAASFLSGTTPVAQFGQIAAAQQGATPVMTPAIQAGVGLNPNAGNQAAQFAQQGFGTQASLYNTQLANNPWASFFGRVGGLGTGVAAGGLNSWISGAGANTAFNNYNGNLDTAAAFGYCHVARLVVPECWEIFYFWKELLAPSWFRTLYNRYSARVAGWLQARPRVAKAIRAWMLAKVKQVVKG